MEKGQDTLTKATPDASSVDFHRERNAREIHRLIRRLASHCSAHESARPDQRPALEVGIVALQDALKRAADERAELDRRYGPGPGGLASLDFAHAYEGLTQDGQAVKGGNRG